MLGDDAQPSSFAEPHRHSRCSGAAELASFPAHPTPFEQNVAPPVLLSLSLEPLRSRAPPRPQPPKRCPLVAAAEALVAASLCVAEVFYGSPVYGSPVVKAHLELTDV